MLAPCGAPAMRLFWNYSLTEEKVADVQAEILTQRKERALTRAAFWIKQKNSGYYMARGLFSPRRYPPVRSDP